MLRPATPLGSRLRENHRADTKCQHGRAETSARAPKSPLRTKAPTDTRRDSRRTSVRPNSSSHRRCRRQRPGAFVGWRSLARKHAVRDPARRREASSCDVRPDMVQRARSARLRPKTKHVWRSSTNRRARSPLRARSLLTRSSCSKVSPPPRRPCRESLANSLRTWNRERRRRPESHLCHRNPERGADARRPPCGGLLTPELTRSPKTQTPD